jgi:hypothetical protein
VPPNVLDPTTLPFDQYQRYRLVSDLVDRMRGEHGADALDVLDVGGRTALVRRFLPHDRVVLVDMEASEEPGLILGDGAALPFRSRSFDVVAAFDTLEHVPPARRAAFVSECARVSKGWIFLAGPYRAPEVDEAEELLQGFLAQKLGLAHRYLEEHRHNGLPERSEVEASLRSAGWRVASIGHGNLERWLALMCMEMYMDADPLLRPIAAQFFRYYNRTLYASDHTAPVYRHVVCAALGDRPLPDGALATQELLAPGIAPRGATRAITALAAELCAFDREQEAWRPELARLQRTIAILGAELDELRAKIETRRLNLETERAERVVERREAARVESELRAAIAERARAHEETAAEVRRTEEQAREIQEELVPARPGLGFRWRNLRRALGWAKPAR